MKIGLLTDAPKHNLALMKISSWHKDRGDSVLLNMPLFPADYTYASVIYEKNTKKYRADEYGGSGFIQKGNGDIFRIGTKPLSQEIDKTFPDYSLYPFNDYSLGFTFRGCYRKCEFCKVHKVENDFNHYSIWDFHDPKFKKICLLNNNTFFDKRWRETFEEIWDADLTVMDENGYDLRLLDDEKADALRKTKFDKQIHYAWDRMEDEKKILEGLKIAPKGMVYVLIGFDTTEEEDLYRCQKIHDAKFDPYIMPYNQIKKEKRFKRFIDTRMYRGYETVKEAWKDYNG